MASAKSASKTSPGKKSPAAPKKPPQDKSFVFMDIVNINKSTGYKASTLSELRDCLGRISDESLFYHTFQYFLTSHMQEHTNDFAKWSSDSLEESALAEKFSNMNPYSFKTISALREELISIIDNHLSLFPEPRPVLPGYEFYFSESITFIFPVGIKARNLAEFLMAIKYIDASSIYYHFFEARSRLRKESDDFSKWIEEVMKSPDTATELRNIDPFMSTLDGIREKIIHIVENGVKREMEVIE